MKAIAEIAKTVNGAKKKAKQLKKKSERKKNSHLHRRRSKPQDQGIQNKVHTACKESTKKKGLTDQ